MKVCSKCNNSINDKAFECPHCGNTKFGNFIEPNEGLKSALNVDDSKIQSNTSVYSNRLESLIDLAISDGELTEKEKQVLFKRAELEGIDLDEFEMVLDSKLKKTIQEKSISTLTNTSILNEGKTLLNPNRYIILEKLIAVAISDGSLTETTRENLIINGISLGIPQSEVAVIIESKVSELKDLINKKPISTLTGTSSILDSDIPLNPNRYIELKNLIDIALSYGSLSDTKKDTLINNGISSGIPLNEISMIIESKISENQKTLSQAAAPKSDKFGDIRKCPACGAIAETFTTKCSDCGQEFINIGVTENINSFFEKLEKIESSRKSSFMDNMLKGVVDDISRKKAQLITSFPVPNTKEDILEFLYQALPQTKVNTRFFSPRPSASERFVANAFKQKCEQLIMKARFSMKEDKKTLEEINNYAKEFGIK